MLASLKRSDFPGKMLVHFILIALCIPFYTSKQGAAYSPDLILVNAFAILYVLSTMAQRRLRLRQAPWLSGAMLGLLLCFNLCSVYVNIYHLQWYQGQLHVTTSFLFFLALLLGGGDEEKEEALKKLLKMAILTNLVGLVPYFLNYYGVSLLNGDVYFIPMEGQFDERRYRWLYMHKSEYALTLIMFLGLIVTYQDRFSSKWKFWAGIGVMAVGLVISNTRTAMVAALLIPGGWLLDQIRRQPKKIRLRYLLCLVPVALGMIILVYIASQKRNLLTLGARTYIWERALIEIRENPYGIGNLCGLRSFPVEAWPYNAANCHNVFLNILLQFSISAGSFYIGIFGVILAASIWYKPSFLTLGIWGAMLIVLMMDWSLLLPQFSLFLLTVYFLFFYKGKPLGSEET